LLEEDQSGVRGEGVVLEPESRESVSLTANIGSAKLHRADLLVA
jgi:hypothetical protein